MLQYPRLRAWSLCLALVCLGVAGVSAQDAATRRSQLVATKAAPGFSERLAKTLDVAASVDEVVALVDEFAILTPAGAERSGLFERAAVLLELSGRFDLAAARYDAAIEAAIGPPSSGLLLSAALCRLQTGEGERALALSQALALVSTDAGLVMRARIISGWASLSLGDSEAALVSARALLATAKSPKERSAALLLSWAASEGEARSAHAAMLKAEYPGSPEAALVAGAVPASPFWFLGFARSAASSPAAPGPELSVSKAEADPGIGIGESDTAPPGAVADTGPRAFQVGLFSDPANAERLATALKGKGFRVSVESRSGGKAQAVLVPLAPGADAAGLLLRLKDAGFEAYPIY